MNRPDQQDLNLRSAAPAEPEHRMDRRKLLGLVTAGTLSLAAVGASQVVAKFDDDRDYGADNSGPGGGDDNSGPGSGDDHSGQGGDNDGTGTAVPAGTASAANMPKMANVSIKDKAFHPDPVIVATGGTVTWTNDDPVTHNVVFDFAKSDPLAPGDTFEWTFDKAGTWQYACTFHVNMTGTVEVRDTANATPASASPAATVKSLAIDIRDFAFDPGDATVPAGTIVTWTNRDATAHTVTGTFADSGSIAPGTTFSHTFAQAGDWSYVCSFHSNMRASIKVTG